MNTCRSAWAFLPLLLVSSLIIKPSLAASSPGTTIKVVVKNDLDKPVPNAAIILDFLGSRQVQKLGMHSKKHWEVHTNQEGLAHFPPIPEGTVQLQVIESRYQTFGQKIDLQGDEKLVEVTLHRPQKQYSAHPDLKPADPPPPPQQ